MKQSLSINMGEAIYSGDGNGRESLLNKESRKTGKE
jgi:hypothetical protein